MEAVRKAWIWHGQCRTVSDALIAAGQHSRIIAAKGTVWGATLPKRAYSAISEEGQVAEPWNVQLAVSNQGVLRFPAYEKRSFRVA
jgi:hypothetical protein